MTTVSDHIISETKLRIMAQCLYIGLQEGLHTRLSKGGFRGGGGGTGGHPPPFFFQRAPSFLDFNAHEILLLSNDLFFTML